MKWRYAAPPLVLVAILVAIAPLVRPEVTHWWWQRQAALPLDEVQTTALQSCEDPGWTGILRLLHQDLDAECAPSQLAAMTAAHLSSRRHQDWVRGLAEDRAAPPRTRLRAGMALLEGGLPPVRGLSLLATHPQVPESDRAEVLRQLVSGELDGSWADPLLWGEVSAWRLAEGDLDASAPVARRLRVESLDPGLDAAHRAWLARVALDAAGYPEWVVQRHRSRRDLGLPEQLPPEVARDAALLDQVCAEAHASSCLSTAADLLDRAAGAGADGVDALPQRSGGLATPLWDLLYDGDQESVAVAADLIQAVGEWVAGAPEGDRGWRLLGAVTARTDDPAAPRQDPVQALLHRRVGPWTTGLAALAVAQVAGAELGVEPWGTGVLLRADGLTVHVGPCGLRSDPVLEPEVPLAPWPVRAVLAQAAAEAALHPAESPRALRLAYLAQRLDPEGVQGLVEQLAARTAPVDSPEAALGRRAGSLLRVGAPPGPEGAEAARRERASAHAWHPPACD